MKRLLSPELKERIFFLHIPKCGGTSIRTAISNVYKPWPLGRTTDILSAREMAMREAEQLAGPRKPFIRTDLLNYHLALSNPRCVMGHYVLTEETVDKYRDKWAFITVLRHPVDRWYSHYFFNKNATSIFTIDLELDEFIKTDLARVLGTVYVSVVTGERESNKLRTPEYVEKAINTFKKFSVVGSLENMDKFCDDFKRHFGVGLSIPRLNVTPKIKRDGWERIPDAINQKVLELCEPDLQVYRSLIGK